MKKNNLLFILYPLAIFVLYPIIRYLYLFVIVTNSNAIDKFVFTRVYFSSPVLIIIGIFMLFLYKGFHRISGLIFLSVGLLWLLFMIRELMHEAPP
jgi:hypothetical protein